MENEKDFDADPWLTKPEAAKQLHVSYGWLSQMVKDGVIPSFRIGTKTPNSNGAVRILQSEVTKYINERRHWQKYKWD